MEASVFGKAPKDATEIARVVSVNGDIVNVQMQEHNACKSCGAGHICHPNTGSKPVIEALNDAHASVGDLVTLETTPSSRLTASFAVFGIPVLTLAVGAILGNNLDAANQDSAVAGALAGLAFGILVVRFVNRFVQGKIAFKPRAVKVLP